MNSPLVFISYSQNDYRLMQELVKHLSVLEQTGNIQLWVDDRIDIGELWYQAIEDAISEAKVAILLVTADFLNSSFINREEVPRLLFRRENDGLVIIPIIATDCLWEAVPWLRDLNIPNRGEPIWSKPYQGRSRLLKGIAAKILDIVKNKMNPNGMLEPEMIQIPGGRFQMGANNDSQSVVVFSDETPLHSIVLPSFSICKFPVTNAQYKEFVTATNYRCPSGWEINEIPHGKLDHPVVNVNWFDAIAYCRWLTENTGKYYRLPSEAEWEKAAKGTRIQSFPWGKSWLPDCCNTKEAEINTTSPVHKFDLGKSEYGVYDLSGNVSEWTISLWNNPETNVVYKYPYQIEDGREILNGDWDLSQILRDELVGRVLRGASFMYSNSFARCSFRRRLAPKNYGVDVGFRVAITPHII